MRWLVVVVTLAGCDKLFSLTQLPDVPDPDATMVDALDPGCRVIDAELVGDTYLDAENTNTPRGWDDALHLRSGNPGLFEFSTGAMATGEHIAAARLSLHPLDGLLAKACSVDRNSCAACPAGSVTAWRLHWATIQWDEGTATYVTRYVSSVSVPWMEAGARHIPDDRSPQVSSGVVEAGASPLVMTMGAAGVIAYPPDIYLFSERLAMLVEVDGDGWYRSADDGNCGNFVAPVVELTVCQ